jgi:regulator of nucleoside diphosphate kinase
MKYGKLILTKKDYKLIKLILINWHLSKELTLVNYEKLSRELSVAEIVKDTDIPTDVVKFGSIVVIETPYGVLNQYELVVPSKKDIPNKKLSVLSAIGSAILGYAEGDEISWNFPAGEKIIRIINVNNNVLKKSGLEIISST